MLFHHAGEPSRREGSTSGERSPIESRVTPACWWPAPSPLLLVISLYDASGVSYISYETLANALPSKAWRVCACEGGKCCWRSSGEDWDAGADRDHLNMAMSGILNQVSMASGICDRACIRASSTVSSFLCSPLPESPSLTPTHLYLIQILPFLYSILQIHACLALHQDLGKGRLSL